jgi:hypothetical protein
MVNTQQRYYQVKFKPCTLQQFLSFDMLKGNDPSYYQQMHPTSATRSMNERRKRTYSLKQRLKLITERGNKELVASSAIASRHMYVTASSHVQPELQVVFDSLLETKKEAVKLFVYTRDSVVLNQDSVQSSVIGRVSCCSHFSPLETLHALKFENTNTILLVLLFMLAYHHARPELTCADNIVLLQCYLVHICMVISWCTPICMAAFRYLYCKKACSDEPQQDVLN